MVDPFPRPAADGPAGPGRPAGTRARSAKEVLESHLELALGMEVEEDLRRNYAPDVLFLSDQGVHRGHDGARHLAGLLDRLLPEAAFTYTNVLVEDGFGFLEWTAQAEGARVEDGADSFVIRDGLIRAQSIHFTVLRD